MNAVMRATEALTKRFDGPEDFVALGAIVVA
jgi:hypothetical protein